MLVGTRTSKLALLQGRMFAERSRINGIEIKGIPSHGDENSERSLKEIGGTGLFVKRLNEKVLDGEIDCAVHSAKDMPGGIEEDLTVCSVFDWEHFHDALVLNPGKNEKNLIIGTSSPRREKQLSRIHPGWTFKNIRGNIDTRIEKLRSGEYDGIVLSEAGIVRMYPEIEFEKIDHRISVPAANQSLIAVVCRRDSKYVEEIKKTEDPVSRLRFDMERAVSDILDFGCSTPNGIFYHPLEKMLYVDLTVNENEITMHRKIETRQDAVNIAGEIKRILL